MPERQALAVIAGGLTTLTDADFTSAIDVAGQLLDAITDRGWALVERP